MAAYQKKMVVAVKSNGKILRETAEGCVFLPFGSEYSLLLKNLDSVNVGVEVEIDGKSVTESGRIHILPGYDFELQGHINNFEIANKFKFIERTDEISSHRGDRIDDGFIRVKFFREKISLEPIEVHHHYYPNYWYPIWITGPWTYAPQIYYLSGQTDSFTQCSSALQEADNAGITVKGSEVNMPFMENNLPVVFEDRYETIVLSLRGIKQTGEQVKEPITVDTRKLCSTCGRSSGFKDNYCSTCGTHL